MAKWATSVARVILLSLYAFRSLCRQILKEWQLSLKTKQPSHTPPLTWKKKIVAGVFLLYFITPLCAFPFLLPLETTWNTLESDGMNVVGTIIDKDDHHITYTFEPHNSNRSYSRRVSVENPAAYESTQIGQSIDVRYIPANPSLSRIAVETSPDPILFWSLCIYGLITTGVLIFIIGQTVYSKLRKPRKAKEYESFQEPQTPANKHNKPTPSLLLPIREPLCLPF